MHTRQLHQTSLSPGPAPAHLLRELAVEAGADPRTVARVMRGTRARGMVHDRIVLALARRGMVPTTAAAKP